MSSDEKQQLDAVIVEDDYGVDEPDTESAPESRPNAYAYSHPSKDDAEEDTMSPIQQDGAAVSTIHSSYLGHIRQLQKTNSALTKKIEYLNAIQSDHTKIKLIKKLQRILREKQLMVDDLAEVIMARGVMTPDALSKHLQLLIESGALDQQNPAKMKKELADARKENQRLLNELRESKKTVRSMEASAQKMAEQSTSRRPKPMSMDAIIDADKQASVDQLSATLLALTETHSNLQSSHHSLQLSLAEHKKLLETVTSENRTLRGYLTQWEASEERRILAEQQNLILSQEKSKWVSEQETLFQEVRGLKSKFAAIIHLKTKAEREFAARLKESKMKTDQARDHAIHLTQQLTLLKQDVKTANEMVQFHRNQQFLHLTAEEKQEQEKKDQTNLTMAGKLLTSKEAILEKHVEQLEKRLQEYRMKYELAVGTEDIQEKDVIEAAKKPDENSADPKRKAASYTIKILRENSRLNGVITTLESRLGTALGEVETSVNAAAEAVSLRTQAQNELQVLQVAMREMAKDLATSQSQTLEKDKRIQEFEQGKIPRMRLQRQNLTVACQRQNVTIQELNKEIEALKSSLVNVQHQQQFGGSTAYYQIPDPAAAPSMSASPSPAPSTSIPSSSAPSRPTTAAASSRPSSASHSRPSVNTTSTVQSPTTSASTNKLASPSKSSQPTVTASENPYSQEFNDNSYDVDNEGDLASSPDGTPASDALNDVGGGDPFSQYDANASADVAVIQNSSPTDEWNDPSGTWTRYVTEDGQAYYYFNNITQESVWVDPLLSTSLEVDYAVQNPTDDEGWSQYQNDGTATVADSTSAANAVTGVASVFPDSSRSVRSSELDITPIVSSRLGDLPQLSSRQPAKLATTAEDEYAIEDDYEVEEPFDLSSKPPANSSRQKSLPPLNRLPTEGHVSTADDIADDVDDVEFPQEENAEIEETF